MKSISYIGDLSTVSYRNSCRKIEKGMFFLEERYLFSDLVAIIERLRGENGCPWDKVQTHQTLREAMLEEAYEVVEAIEKDDISNLKEELGDVLLQVVFHGQIEKEAGNFTIDDVVDGIAKKMVYRHPHVFGAEKVDTADEVLENWEMLKKKEKKQKTQTEVLRSVPDALPALTKAKKVQKKAADVGFEFPDLADVMRKVEEEWAELLEALGGEKTHIEEEYGDILFSMVNLARFLQINPEFALTNAIKKFINRFEYIEDTALSGDRVLSDMTLGELETMWNKAKSHLVSTNSENFEEDKLHEQI